MGENRVRRFFCALASRQAFATFKCRRALQKTRIATTKGTCALSWEAYNYAGQNPVMKVDPTGLAQVDSMRQGNWIAFAIHGSCGYARPPLHCGQLHWNSESRPGDASI